ncbi:MAG TPA: hypothetical protein VIY29_15810 [Ktedonobacteraceae bacterium]
MALATKPPTRQPTVRRIWRTPGSWFNWLFLLLSLVILAWVYLLYRSAVATQLYPGPYNVPFRQFGIVSFCLVVLVVAYTLRRRFVRRLPGKVQNWLWLHIWFGVISILIAFMHEDFLNITHDFVFQASRFSEAVYGMSALLALLLLVMTGVLGRLLDVWQARVIASEADSNGVGISRAVEERIFELTLAVERLSAGKSAQFKQYCEEALRTRGRGAPPQLLPVLAPHEVNDFQHTFEVLGEQAQLERSLLRQRRARLMMRMWRYVHISVACAALVVIGYHSVVELWKMLVLHY